jgi:hypothetical protein
MRNKHFLFPVTTLAGTTLKNFLAVCKGHVVERKYWRKLVLSALVCLIFEIFNAVERLFWKKRIVRFELKEPPVFIIGPWRSGTTLLHNLLSQDPVAAYATTFQAVFPNLLLTQSFWIKPVANYIGPSSRPFDNVRMDMDFPQEEEFGLMNLQPYSIYKFFLFPSDFDQIIQDELFTGNLCEEGIVLWKKKYKEMVAKAVFNTGGARYISKNPCNIARLGLLKEIYPDAKFIFIHRSPYKTVESLYRFILEVFPGVQLEATPVDFTREKVVLLYEKIIRTYLNDRCLIDPKNLVELRMEDFFENPVGSIRDIYKSFNYDNFNELKPALEQYLINEGQSRNGIYEMEEETVRLVNLYLSDVLKVLGYERIDKA